MLNIQAIINSDANGNYPTKLIMRQLYNANLGIEFPNKSLSETCLADLKCEGKRCIQSFSEGTKWNDELRTYTERRLILCFN